MSTINLIFPHQLFEDNPLLDNDHPVYLVEEILFFKHFKFHKQKLAYHRASMKSYAHYLSDNGKKVTYIDCTEDHADVRKLVDHLAGKGVTQLCLIDPVDDWLIKRIQRKVQENEIDLEMINTPMFLNTPDDLDEYFGSKSKKFHHQDFYKQQRKKRDILMENGEPAGGQWSFDGDNRKKYPKDKQPPSISFPESTKAYEEAVQYVQEHFPDNPGELPDNPRYPINFEQSKKWLKAFLHERFEEFGPYEDAIVSNESILNHSMLTPMLNTGLLTPQYVLDEILKDASKNDRRINSVEGLIRQIIGWREFMRGLYLYKGVEERTKNYWGFDRKIPQSFYEGTTGIAPVDDAIHKVQKTAYNHHIERLMVLGNFMLLCEFNPDEVYHWFMELYIDAYDWVMVPNVYGMSQFADGGLMATKPYISSSNYIKKMSDYGKADWNETWDALFWRFMSVHRDFFDGNPRLSMLMSSWDKKDKKEQQSIIGKANQFLGTLK